MEAPRLDKTQLLEKATVLVTFIRRFRFIVVFVIFSVMYGYIITQVNGINARPPSDKQIADKATASPRPKIDQSLVDKITSLEEENVQVKTIFNEARKNPFAE
ncbi:MAG TPA: hypothetical protein VK674_03865 [Candidatus Limnocylindria bacterium]|nr:hypothetical protein [Candidatus Limnocylindria bacterium]